MAQRRPHLALDDSLSNNVVGTGWVSRYRHNRPYGSQSTQHRTQHEEPMSDKTITICAIAAVVVICGIILYKDHSREEARPIIYTGEVK